MTRALGLPAACLVAAFLGGCATDDSSTTYTLPPLVFPQAQHVRGASLRDIEPLAASTPIDSNSDLSGLDQYPTMLWLLTASGVLDEIGTRPVTILAPSETAFRDFASVDNYGLMSNPAAMAPILRRHVILGVFDTEELAAAQSVATLAGERLAVWRNGRMVMVNEIIVTLPAPTVGDDSVGDDSLGDGVVKSVVYGTNRLLLFPVGKV